MGFNFPNTPTVNQQYTPVGGPTYTWDGTVWKVTGTSGVVTADSYNRIVNGAMQHSQENARTAGTVNAYYPADQWRTAVAGSGYTATFASVDNVTDPVFAPAYLSIACSVAKASLAAGDACAVLENLEGSRMADLAWGTAKARPVVVRLTAWGMVGSFTMSIRNAAGDRSYAVPIATTATPTEFVIPVPGCTDGTWPTDSNAWGSIMVGVASGTTTQAPATNQWLTGNYWGHAGMSNLMAAVNNTLRVTHVALYADPNATGVPLPWVTPDYASELAACQRYWQQFSRITHTSYALASGGTGRTISLCPPMRANPAVTGTWSYTNAGSGTAVVYSPDTVAFQAVATTQSSVIWNVIPAMFNARM